MAVDEVVLIAQLVAAGLSGYIKINRIVHWIPAEVDINTSAVRKILRSTDSHVVKAVTVDVTKALYPFPETVIAAESYVRSRIGNASS